MLKIVPINHRMPDYKRVVALYKSLVPESEQLPVKLLHILACRRGTNFSAIYASAPGDDPATALKLAGIVYTLKYKNTVFILILGLDAKLSSGQASSDTAYASARQLVSSVPAASNFSHAKLGRELITYLRHKFPQETLVVEVNSDSSVHLAQDPEVQTPCDHRKPFYLANGFSQVGTVKDNGEFYDVLASDPAFNLSDLAKLVNHFLWGFDEFEILSQK